MQCELSGKASTNVAGFLVFRPLNRLAQSALRIKLEVLLKEGVEYIALFREILLLVILKNIL